MKDEIKQNLKESTTWLRVLYMILFALIYWVVEFVIAAIVIFQFVAVLITRKPNDALLGLGQSMSSYVYQILRFLTYNSNRHPYPFAPWPKGEPEAEPEPEPEPEPVAEAAVDEAGDEEGNDESGPEEDKQKDKQDTK
ncbi:MAG: hypothetical protein BMS9Abin26_1868 [Gammaproteobacteria bacterium]|nr:MAG: hypothetical protein BMS9Abin26_1868 [Gammaproteobacteria bacterium]